LFGYQAIPYHIIAIAYGYTVNMSEIITEQIEVQQQEDNLDATPGGQIVYTEDELIAMRQVRTTLLEEHGIEESRVGYAFLAVATINSKLRVEETATKIVKLLDIMQQLGCDGEISDDFITNAKHELHPYPTVGVDKRGCSTTWIRAGSPVPKEEERHHCQACIMQYLAVHADSKTLRDGVSFILDLSGREDVMTAEKVGNEQLIQSFYQAIPQRPQVILIAGTSFLLRTFVNASIYVASVFVKAKILERISFTTVEEAVEMLPEGSAPVYVGGKGGGNEQSYEDYVKERMAQLPIPDL